MTRMLTLPEWEKYLYQYEMEALDDRFYQDHVSKFSANEVLDALVEYNGGVASGYQIRMLIQRVYGIELK